MKEAVRRVRVGELRRLLRHRYGPILPDDDAGLEDLMQLLMVVSLKPNGDAAMRMEAEVFAPWLPEEEIKGCIAEVKYTPPRYRMLSAQDLGDAMNLEPAERELLKIKTFRPADCDDEQLAELKRERERRRSARRRRARGAKPRAQYLAQSVSRSKPWEALGISRATYYRRRAKGRDTMSGRFTQKGWHKSDRNEVSTAPVAPVSPPSQPQSPLRPDGRQRDCSPSGVSDKSNLAFRTRCERSSQASPRSDLSHLPGVARRSLGGERDAEAEAHRNRLVEVDIIELPDGRIRPVGAARLASVH